MEENKIYEMSKWKESNYWILPNKGERVLCWGHRTFCCEEDMEKEPAWHEVIFTLKISSYTIKPRETMEDSIITDAEIYDSWEIAEEGDPKEHVIGVTKWKHLPEKKDGMD